MLYLVFVCLFFFRITSYTHPVRPEAKKVYMIFSEVWGKICRSNRRRCFDEWKIMLPARSITTCFSCSKKWTKNSCYYSRVFSRRYKLLVSWMKMCSLNALAWNGAMSRVFHSLTDQPIGELLNPRLGPLVDRWVFLLKAFSRWIAHSKPLPKPSLRHASEKETCLQRRQSIEWKTGW